MSHGWSSNRSKMSKSLSRCQVQMTAEMSWRSDSMKRECRMNWRHEKSRGRCNAELQRRSSEEKSLASDDPVFNVSWTDELWFDYSISMSSDRKFRGGSPSTPDKPTGAGWSVGWRHRCNDTSKNQRGREGPMATWKKGYQMSGTHPGGALVDPTLLHFYWPLESCWAIYTPFSSPFMVAGLQRKHTHTKEDLQATIVLINHIHRL
jgi:hypothetical protein